MAIIFVVLFHLNGQVWSHGYLGVDVFLVITGYLLFRARLARAGNDAPADMGKFALRRICRIVPAMTLVISLVVILGAFLLMSGDELLVCQVGSRACMGKANVLLAQSFEDYFAPDTSFMPLLHLWYLSVVLQVYLMWAIGNLALQRLPKRWITAILIIIAGASLAYNYSFPIHEWLREMQVPVWKQIKDVSYYSTLPRLWEILAGGLACVLPSFACKKWPTILSGVSLLAIILSSAPLNLPGGGIRLPNTLIVVVCTVFVIRYLPESSLQRVLSNKVLLWLGGISFSLYLVHMPIIIFGHMWVYNQPTLWYEIMLLALSVAAARAFWWGVEKRKQPWWLIIVLWVGAYMLCKGGRSTDGYKEYFSGLDVKMEIPTYQNHTSEHKDLLADMSAAINTYVGCCYKDGHPEGQEPPLLADMGNSDLPPTILLMGDSHADHFYAGMDHLFREKNISGVFLTSIVLPYHGIECYMDPQYYWNAEKEEALMKWLGAHPEISHIIIGQLHEVRVKKYGQESIEHSMRDFLSQLKKQGKKVIVISETPVFTIGLLQHYAKIFTLRATSLDDHEAFHSECTREEFMERCAAIHPVLAKMEQEGLCTVVDPLKTLAPGESFYSHKGKELLMRDNNHMYPNMSIEMAHKLWPQLEKALAD